jgi:hypothetical protein
MPSLLTRGDNRSCLALPARLSRETISQYALHHRETQTLKGALFKQDAGKNQEYRKKVLPPICLDLMRYLKIRKHLLKEARLLGIITERRENSNPRVFVN